MTLERMWRDAPVTIIPGKDCTSTTRLKPDACWMRNGRSSAGRAWNSRDNRFGAKVSALKAREAFYAAAEEAGIVTSTTVAPPSLPWSEGPVLYGRGRKRKLKRDM